MKFKKIMIITFISIISILLSACGVGESNVLYNKLYENATVQKISCGRGTHITVTFDNDKKEETFNLNESDCFFLSEHKFNLETVDKKSKINISFIGNGKYIDGIMINK